MKALSFFLLLIFLLSCQDDDICTETTTPKLVVVFSDENTTDRITLDSLYIEYELSEGVKDTLKLASIDSVTIPLRIDNQPMDFYFYNSTLGQKDKLHLEYSSKDVFISKACGFKKNYENLSYTLESMFNIQSITPLTTNIIDEHEIHIALNY